MTESMIERDGLFDFTKWPRYQFALYGHVLFGPYFRIDNETGEIAVYERDRKTYEPLPVRILSTKD